jgi:hypothetical protein
MIKRLLFSRVSSATRLAAVVMGFCSVAVVNAAPSGAANTAAERTAREGAACKKLGAFYWEIGDVHGPLVSGSIGSDYSIDTPMKIASASKWVWGAYVLEKIGPGQELSAAQRAQLEMRSGQTSFPLLACPRAKTVVACLNARSNAKINPDDIGYFYYGGGHDQQLAVDLGLGNLDAEHLTQEVLSYLGNDIGLSYFRPLPAGGMQGTPAAYAAFLRKILSGKLRMHDALGSDPVCTLPARCAEAHNSPVKEAWHYSLNHWLEDDPVTGDGSYSSPGLEGFYPWISADKTRYGILARERLGRTVALDSVACGRNIRKAFVSGVAVLQ